LAGRIGFVLEESAVSDSVISGQSFDLFEALFRDSIIGLPSHITKMSVHLDISEDKCPEVELTRAVTGDNGKLLMNDEQNGIKTQAERYRLVTIRGKVKAEKIPDEVHSPA
jgi:hypothetical protein